MGSSSYDYEAIGASQSSHRLTVDGGTGDYLRTLIISVTNAVTGTVSIRDGNGPEIPIVKTGTAVGTYTIDIKAVSNTGRWSVTTGAGATVVAIHRAIPRIPAAWTIDELFSSGELGVYLDASALPTIYQDSAGTIPGAVGSVVGLMLDKSGNGINASQASAGSKPLLKQNTAGRKYLDGDFVDDKIGYTNAITNGEAWIDTLYGHFKSEIHGGTTTYVPLPHTCTYLTLEGGLTDLQRQQLSAYFGTSKAYLVAVSSDTTIANMRVYTGGATTNVLFVGANGATVTKALSLNSNTSYDVSTDGLTAPVAVVWPDALSSSASLTTFFCHTNQLTGSIPSLSANTALTQFHCYTNQLTGSIPSLTANTALTVFSCHTNQLTGSIPDLSANTALTIFSCYTNQLTGSIPSLTANTALTQFLCYTNQLTGSIPDLSANTALTIFSCYINQLTGWTGGTVSATLGNFQAQNNLLTQAAVDAILAAFVAAGRTSASGTCVLNLGGTGNATPSATGLNDKSTLIGRGWTVTTN